ncbi:cation-transporting P-type ATPase [Lactococcus cremoris]|uniref:cation-transporting P-type ATPase n=1 Tax=Lactococcus lactis subsp. cremoris TaxID=1359 RepID=UPI0037C17D01
MQRYNQSVNEVLEETKSQLEGLKPKEVELRQAENGFNELKEKKKTANCKMKLATLRE